MFVIKDKKLDMYVELKTFTQDINIRVDIVPVANIEIATILEDQNEIDYVMNIMKDQGDDVNNYEVLNYDDELVKIKAKEDEQSVRAMGNAWNNSSEETKKNLLQKILEQKGPDAVIKFMKDVENGIDLNTATAGNTCNCGSNCNCNTSVQFNHQDLVDVYNKYHGYAIQLYTEESEDVDNYAVTKIIPDEDEDDSVLYMRHPQSLTNFVNLDCNKNVFDAGAVAYLCSIPFDDDAIQYALDPNNMPFSDKDIIASKTTLPLQGTLLDEFNSYLKDYLDE